MANYTEALAAYQALAPTIDKLKTLGDALSGLASLDNEIAEKTAVLTKLRADVETANQQVELAKLAATSHAQTAEQLVADAKASAVAHLEGIKAEAHQLAAAAEAHVSAVKQQADAHAASLVERAKAEAETIVAAAKSELHTITERINELREKFAAHI